MIFVMDFLRSRVADIPTRGLDKVRYRLLSTQTTAERVEFESKETNVHSQVTRLQRYSIKISSTLDLN